MTDDDNAAADALEVVRRGLEVEKLRLEIADLKSAAEQAGRLAELELKEAEARTAEAVAEAEVKKIEADDERQRVARIKVREAGRSYNFRGGVGDLSVSSARAQMAEWSMLDKFNGDSPSAFTLNITSYGGSVFDGFSLFDDIRMYSTRGHHVTTRIRGVAASMAGVLLQAGDKRVIGPESYLHIHEPASGSIGKMSEMKDEAKLLDSMFKKMCRIYADRSGGRITAEELYGRAERNELWFSAEEALELGFVDEVG